MLRLFNACNEDVTSAAKLRLKLPLERLSMTRRVLLVGLVRLVVVRLEVVWPTFPGPPSVGDLPPPSPWPPCSTTLGQGVVA